MKLLVSLITVLITSPAFSCDEPATERFIYNMLNYKSGGSQWRAVKGKTFEENRSWRVFAHVGRGLEDSYAIYKGEKYTVDEAEFCKTASNRLQVKTEEYGTVVIERRGGGDESILIGRRGIFSLAFRPDHMVERQR
jgi:hypothetical protein